MVFVVGLLGILLVAVLAVCGVLVFRLVAAMIRVVEGYQTPMDAVDPPNLGVPGLDLPLMRQVGDPTDGIIPDLPGYPEIGVLPYVDPWSIDPTYEAQAPESLFDAPVLEDGTVDMGVSYEKLSDLGRNEGMME
jgi:hypothetical protein